MASLSTNLAMQSFYPTMEPTIQRCILDSQDNFLHNQRDIRDFFEEASYEDSNQSETTFSWDSDESILFP